MEVQVELSPAQTMATEAERPVRRNAPLKRRLACDSALALFRRRQMAKSPPQQAVIDDF